MATSERVTAVGHFSDRTHAEHAVAELQASGFLASVRGRRRGPKGASPRPDITAMATRSRRRHR